jgi:ankyrin repeat protein
LELAEQSIKAGALINKVNKGNITVLFLAIVKQDTKMIKLLLENGANPNYSAQGLSLFHVAIQSENTEIIKQLLLAGVDINQLNEAGETALYAATVDNQKKIFDFLLENGANPNTPTVTGSTPLQAAKDRENKYMIDRLSPAVAKTPKGRKSEGGKTPKGRKSEGGKKNKSKRRRY